jgi:hypothetical protein
MNLLDGVRVKDDNITVQFLSSFATRIAMTKVQCRECESKMNLTEEQFFKGGACPNCGSAYKPGFVRNQTDEKKTIPSRVGFGLLKRIILVGMLVALALVAIMIGCNITQLMM